MKARCNRRSMHGMNPASLFIASLLALFAHVAHADLMLYPTRVVLEGQDRAAQVELINNGEESATYRISLVNRRMTETGEIVPVDTPKPDERFADSLLRYSPRQIRLAPGEAQTIRLMADVPKKLPEGEYRSHLQIDRLPAPMGESSIETATTNGDRQIGVQLRALIGASIPVIVREGDPSASVSISDLALRQHEALGLPVLSMELHRRGNRSVYGDITVTFFPSNGQQQEVGQAGGVAVYTPNNLRRASLILEPPASGKLSSGKLQVTYSQRPENGGKVLAQATLDIP
jgi:hypothetical protein